MRPKGYADVIIQIALSIDALANYFRRYFEYILSISIGPNRVLTRLFTFFLMFEEPNHRFVRSVGFYNIFIDITCRL